MSTRKKKLKPFKLKDGKDLYKYLEKKRVEIPEPSPTLLKKGFPSSKKKLVDFIFNYFQTEIAIGPDPNSLTSDNYVFWITNNLGLLYRDYKNEKRNKLVEQLIDGPSYKKKGNDVGRKEVETTHKHINNLLMNLPYKDLFALIGLSLFYK